jgi:hypothetical protein
LDAMRKAKIRGALVGVEAVTPEGLKSVFKDFNYSGEGLVQRLQTFREHGVHVLGSFIFGLPTDRPETFDATAELAQRAGITFAQFVMLTPFPGTVDFYRWEKAQEATGANVNGIPLTRYWLIPAGLRPKMFTRIRLCHGMRSASARSRYGTLFTASPPSGNDLAVCHPSGHAWRSCSCPNYTGKCMPVPGLQRTAHDRVEHVSGPACLRSLAGAFFRAGRCQSWKFLNQANG